MCYCTIVGGRFRLIAQHLENEGSLVISTTTGSQYQRKNPILVDSTAMPIRQENTCIYCGARPNESVDHTPSKGLFPKPAPSNLITVPCCFECNRSFSKDEEYFRTILVYSQYGQIAPAMVWEKVERSLDRKESRLFDLLLDNLLVSDEKHFDVEISVDHIRIDRVLVKTLRGLYFSHFSARLTEGEWSLPRVGSVEDISSIVTPWFGNNSFIEIGPPIFAYRFVEVNDPTFSSIWQIVYYQSFSCLIGIKNDNWNHGREV